MGAEVLEELSHDESNPYFVFRLFCCSDTIPSLPVIGSKSITWTVNAKVQWGGCLYMKERGGRSMWM